MNSRHEMPFGAECGQHGTTRFRLWAPKAHSVSLVLDEAAHTAETMTRLDGGWFELISDKASAGTRYQFQIDGLHIVPDPASRYQPSSVHGPSEVIDPAAFEWHDAAWHGRPWDESVIYEMHVGAFSPEGTFEGAAQKLDYLVDLGIAVIEIMPVASFPGERNWGYDGVLPYAPAHSYGRPEDLKRFIDAAHAKHISVLLDVVYNHFGPEGNYLWLYAPQFFTDRHHTPWGQAINFDGEGSRTVRDYFIHNALYWLEEYHFDGCRFDAVDMIVDDSAPDFLTELADTIRRKFAKDRLIHLVLENGNNEAHYLRRDQRQSPIQYSAQWNDDIHHALHVLVTGEKDGYYKDYSQDPAWHLGRCLAEGFSFQGDISHYRDNTVRGEPSGDLPPTAFISFLQNHDQIGNRAFGERIIHLADPAALKAAVAIMLLAPSPPLLFMGEEFGARTPFLFFCDFGPELAAKVTAGRRSEFAKFALFHSPQAQARIPDPNSEATFLASKLDWSSLDEGEHKQWMVFYRDLLMCRRKHIVPRIARIASAQKQFRVLGDRIVSVSWLFTSGGSLNLFANFSNLAIRIPELQGSLLYSTPPAALQQWTLVPLSATWLLDE